MVTSDFQTHVEAKQGRKGQGVYGGATMDQPE